MAVSQVQISAKVNEYLDCDLIRAKDASVLFQVKLLDSSRKFDKHRLLNVWIDGKVEIDFCNNKSVDELLREHDPEYNPGFYFNDFVVWGVIWNVLKNTNSGYVGKMLQANSVSFQIYFDDYTTENLSMPAPELASLKQDIASKLLIL